MPVTYSGTGSISTAGIWAPIVTINSVDVTAKVIGDITVEAEEGSARIASLALRPGAAEPFTIPAWVGKSVTIDICDFSTGSATNIQRLFAGLIDTPTLDLDARTIALTCTDNLQNVLEAMTNAAIDAAIPSGYASPVIFDPAARGWTRSQDRLSTIPKSLELSPAGALRLTDWAPKATADLAFTDQHILESSIAVSMAGRSQLTNQVNIDFGYRFPRVKAEAYQVTFSYVNGTNIDTYVDASGWFLQRSAVETAIKATGGTILSITYDALPNAAVGSWVPGPYDNELCMGFTADVSFDYTQTIEEQFTLTVSAPASITAVGTLSDRLSGALEGLYAPAIAVETTMVLYKNDISGIPPQDTATAVVGSTTSANVTLTAETNRAAADAALQALIAVAKVKVWASHRQNNVSASVALNPSIDLDQTIQIAIPGVTAKGKVRSVTHRLSSDTGLAISEFVLAICSVAGTGVTHADSAVTAPAGSTPATTPLASTPTVVFNGTAAGDHTVTVTFPAVTSAERDRRVVPISANYSAGLTEDVLTVTL